MDNKKHIIIYSHGFAVQRDDMGLFTDIAEFIPEVESFLFDYYEINKAENKILTCSFSNQVKKLNEVVYRIRSSYPEAIIDLICHSQGTIVAAMAKPDGVRKTIMISPVFDIDIERSLNRYRSKSSVKIDLDGTSEIPSSTGLIKVIPKEYWQERSLIKPFAEYNSFANKTEVIAIEGNQDELLPRVDLSDLDSRIKVISIDGDHNFSGSTRAALKELVRKILL